MSLEAVARNDAADFEVPSLAKVPALSLEFLAERDLNSSLKDEIAAFLDIQRTSHPFQFPQWSEGNSIHVLIRGNRRLQWYAHCGVQYPLSRRMPLVRSVFVNRGPVCDDPELWNTGMSMFHRELAGRGFVHVDVAPDWVISDFQVQLQEDARASLRLDLRADNEQIFSGFRKNTRYEIRRAERMGVCICQGQSSEQIDEFLSMYARMADRKGFSPDALDHIRQIIGWLMTKKSRGQLLLACHEDVLLGGVIVVRAGQRCWYVWGASESHREVNVGHILQWHALLWAKSHGCTEYDFGGYTVGAVSGPAWFKQGFGGSLVHFQQARRSVLRPWYHYFLRRLSRV